MDPAISPDGKSIAFISNRSGHWSLWTGNADGTGLRELAAQRLLPFHPAWSPDSREIAFDSVASGKGEIWLIRRRGRTPEAAGWHARRRPGPFLVPGWQTSVLLLECWRLAADLGGPGHRRHSGSTDARSIVRPCRIPGWALSLSRQRIVSRNLAYPARAPIARMEAWLTRAGELIRETLPVTGHRFWALGQGGIYFVDAQKTPAALKLVDLTSRTVTVMATLPKPPAKFTRGLSISPDGRYALYCQDDVDRNEIRVVENFR